MSDLPELISTVRSGVVRLAFHKEREQVGSGSGFLARGQLVTNSHVIRGGAFDVVEVSFGDQDLNQTEPVRLLPDHLHQHVSYESLEDDFDCAVLDISQDSELAGRYQFDMQKADDVARVGDQVLFFGFPFGTTHLTAHVGYISADFREGGIHRLQIDGSINPGNSGGPLFHLRTGKVIAIVTQTKTGLEADFDQLIETISNNERILAQQDQMITLGDVNPVQAIRATMTILLKVAANMKRSANVGIGYAFCIEHLLEHCDFVSRDERPL